MGLRGRLEGAVLAMVASLALASAFTKPEEREPCCSLLSMLLAWKLGLQQQPKLGVSPMLGKELQLQLLAAIAHPLNACPACNVTPLKSARREHAQVIAYP